MMVSPRTWALTALLTGYLVLSGWFHIQAIGHTHAHAHHKATTHASPICSWLCATGQVIQVSDLVRIEKPQPVAIVESFIASHTPRPIRIPPATRGPPPVIS